MNENVVARTLENGRLEFWCKVCEEGIEPDLPIELDDLARFGDLFSEDHQHPFVGSDTKLLPHIAFSSELGPDDGCILVFSTGLQTAKFIAWKSGECVNVDEYSDLAIHEIEEDADGVFPIEHVICLGDHAMLADNNPHVVAQPVMCTSCNAWGFGLTDDDKCGRCGQHPGDALVALIRSGKNGAKNE